MLQLAARIRIGVAGAAEDEEGAASGMLLFKRHLRKARIVAADLVELARQCGVVAGIAENHAAEPALFPFNAQHRHFMIHGPRTIHVNDISFGTRHAAVDAETGLAAPERK